MVLGKCFRLVELESARLEVYMLEFTQNNFRHILLVRETQKVILDSRSKNTIYLLIWEYFTYPYLICHKYIIYMDHESTQDCGWIWVGENDNDLFVKYHECIKETRFLDYRERYKKVVWVTEE